MNAIKFIQQHGVEKAREVVDGAPDGTTHYRVLSCSTGYTKNISISECYIWFRGAWQECEWPSKIFTSSNLQVIAELKRLIESVDRINACGGLYGFKTYCNGDYSQEDLQAIADYEAIGGEHV